MAKSSKTPKKKGSGDPQKISDFEASVDNQQVAEPTYTEKESQYRNFLLQRLENAKEAREGAHDEFNGMTYTQRYIENFQAANSYTPPRKNPEDTSVVTGTTREKKLAIINSVLSLVFDTVFRAFDPNNIEDQQLGEAMSDCVFQSNRMELWDEKKIYAYTELVDQGDVFLEDNWVDETRIDKKKIRLSEVTEETFKDFNPNKGLKVIFSGARRSVIPGPQVFLGNVRQPDFKLQPYVFTRKVIPYAEARAIYGHLPRFKNVSRDLTPITDDGEHFGYIWRLMPVAKDMVEVITYQDKYADEFQILLNGVMQLPVEFPMPWEFGEYNLVQGHLEPISAFFAYSKSVPDKTALEQQVLDEMYRLAVLKTQKSFMPPIANYSANILTKNMFLPGKVNNNLEKGEVEVLGGSPNMYSMQQSEFEMIRMVKGFIDEKSVSPALQGKEFKSRATATEVDNVMKQAKMQLGVMIFGFMNLHLNLDLLRLYVLLENLTKDKGEKVSATAGKIEKKFATIATERDIGGRGVGIKRIEFTDSPNTPEQLYDLEEGVTRDETGKPLKVAPPAKPIKITQLSPTAIRSIQWRWYPELTVNERESSLADRISFEDRLAKAMQLFGVESINQEYAKQQFAVKNKLNASYFFNKNTPDIVPDQAEIDKMEEGVMTKQARPGQSGPAAAARQGFGG